MSNLKFNEVTLPGDENVYQVDQLTDSAMNVAVTVGGLSAGTTYASGTRVDTILRDILEPTLYPTLTNPSASISGTGSKLLEIGQTQSSTITITLNRGSISPAYGTSGYRSGVATKYLLNGTEQTTNAFNVTVSDSLKSFSGIAYYAAGEQPKDSKGNDYSTPLAAGSKSTSTLNYVFVYALWANASDITTVAKQSLVNNNSTKLKDFIFPAQTVANPEIFDVPASWTVTAVQVKNDLSGAYEDASSQFTVTDTTHEDAAGNTVNYKRYTFNMGMATGSRTVRVRWS